MSTTVLELACPRREEQVVQSKVDYKRGLPVGLRLHPVEGESRSCSIEHKFCLDGSQDMVTAWSLGTLCTESPPVTQSNTMLTQRDRLLPENSSGDRCRLAYLSTCWMSIVNPSSEPRTSYHQRGTLACGGNFCFPLVSNSQCQFEVCAYSRECKHDPQKVIHVHDHFLVKPSEHATPCACTMKLLLFHSSCNITRCSMAFSTLVTSLEQGIM